jgi:hypothetical protein
MRSYKIGLCEVWELCRMILNETGTHVITCVVQYVKVLPFRLHGLQSSLFQKSNNLFGAAYTNQKNKIIIINI